jgi:DNA-binding transcriptional ArsR family regulator
LLLIGFRVGNKPKPLNSANTTYSAKPDLMLKSLITSQTRIRLLKKFFLNSNITAHLRGLEAEFGESSNGIRIELNRFEEAGLLTSSVDGNRKLYQANKTHPLFSDIHNIILKETGLDKVIENVIHRMGDLLCVYLTGDFAHGKDTGTIELILVGNNIDREYLNRKVKQAEELTGRSVNHVVLDPIKAEAELMNYKPCDLVPLWMYDDKALRPAP